MENKSVTGITLNMLKEARETVKSSPLGVINTPMIIGSQTTLPLNTLCKLHIKMENLQKTGSFKIRGVSNQFARKDRGLPFVTMSAGNYGKSFAYTSNYYGCKGKVVMPETAPVSRSILIQLFPGCGSLGFEILEVVENPDVVVVCCGGGGLLAGVAAAIKLSGHDDTLIYGVEPEGACTMFRSFIENKPVAMDAKSIASGLAPPFAGALPYELCRQFVKDIVLVSDEHIKAAVSTLYQAGLVVEPSGAAGFAALANSKIPDIGGKDVVVVLSGGNIGKEELADFPE